MEIGTGAWGGRCYASLAAAGERVVRAGGLLCEAPGGERYREVAARVGGWLAETDRPGDRPAGMHGISSRVLRGAMTGAVVDAELGVPIAPGLPQGTAVLIEQGCETVLHRGTGYAPA